MRNRSRSSGVLIAIAAAVTAASGVFAQEVEAAARTPIGDRLRASAIGHARIEIRDVEIDPGTRVDLDLAPMPIVTPRTHFVVGRASKHFAWDPSRVRAFRGTVRGRPSDAAFVVITPERTMGYVKVDGERRWIDEGARGPARSSAAAAPPPGTPLCGAELAQGAHGHAHGAPDRSAHAAAGGAAREQGGLAGDPAPGPASTRVIKLAIETDYEFFSMIGDVQAATDYVVALYAADSDIFLSETNARLELTFVRIWDTPDDLFNEPDPLNPFVQYWNENMDEVDRDVAQLLSGRRNLPWGGIAYVGALCTNFHYSVVGYALGFFPDLSTPSVYNFDVPVTTHELGHNFGALHTHSYGLDDCDQLDNTPQRGTIMGYCSQTVSGGNSVTDNRFGTFIAQVIRDYLAETACGYGDCDGNGLDDAQEIALGAVPDANGDGIPDGCQDCNGNGALDPVEIAEGGAADVDGNGVPDSCQPDCNGNGAPDSWDIATGFSTDAHLDGVPDECEEDCDGDGQSDQSQIQADLSLDVNRNRMLDSCEDCDGDGTPDLVQLDGAWDAWAASTWTDGAVRRFNAITGVLAGVSSPAAVSGGKDLRITANGRILVASGADDRIVELARDGSVVGDFVSAGSGGLDDPSAIAFAPNGDVLVTSRGSNAVLRYDGTTGAFLAPAVAPGAGGLVQPFGLAFGPDGLLYVNGSDNRVRRYHGGTGAFMGVFISPGGGGGLNDPRSMLFLPGGDLLIASSANNSLLRYAGANGAFIGKWNKGGTTNALTFDQPWGLRIGPNGNVYASRHQVPPSTGEAGGFFHDDLAELHVNSSRIYEFDVDTGNFLRSYVTGHDTGLWLPTGFDFMPDDEVDADRNNVLDACENPFDLNGDGAVNGAEITIILGEWGPCRGCAGDLNGDGLVDGGDIAILLGSWTG